MQKNSGSVNPALKPIIKYPGGKGRELGHILPAIPKTIDRFFEPFIGGGATYFSITNTEQYYINDVSNELIETYKAVKEQNPNFLNILSHLNDDWKSLSKADNFGMSLTADEYKLLPYLFVIKQYGMENFFIDYMLKMHKRKQLYIQKEKENGNIISEENKALIFETVLKSSYYAAIREIYNENRKSGRYTANTAFYFFIREYCYSSMFRFSADGSFNVPYGGMSYNSKTLDEKIDYLRSEKLISRLNQTGIYDKDFGDFLGMFKFKKNDFLFLDPPYDSEFSTYDENEFGKRDHTRLAQCLLDANAKWLLVIKDTDFIRGLYPQNDKCIFYREFDKNYSVSFMNRNDRQANHLMITNYEV
jgi:DNA adenine methylase